MLQCKYTKWMQNFGICSDSQFPWLSSSFVACFTLTRNRNYCWLRKTIGDPRSFARVLHQAVERARVSNLQIFVSAPWNALRCLCLHGEIVYRDINFFNQPFPSANSTHMIFPRQSSLLLPRGIRIRITWNSCDQDDTLLDSSHIVNLQIMKSTKKNTNMYFEKSDKFLKRMPMGEKWIIYSSHLRR